MVVGTGVGVRLIRESPFCRGVVKFKSIVASWEGSIGLGGARGGRRGEGGVEFQVGRVGGHRNKIAGARSAVDLSILGVIEVDKFIHWVPPEYIDMLGDLASVAVANGVVEKLQRINTATSTNEKRILLCGCCSKGKWHWCVEYEVCSCAKASWSWGNRHEGRIPKNDS